MPHIDILVGRDNLDEEKERLGVGVIVLLELSGDRLEVLGVGWRGKC
jgi:hypothetical protein